MSFSTRNAYGRTPILGTFWSEDGDGSENVAWKGSLHCDCSNSLFCQMYANSSGVEFLTLNVKENFNCGLFTSSIKSEIRHFHVILVQWRLKKCYKNVCCSRGAVVVHIRPISLLMFSLTSPSDLKVPILTRLSRGTKLKLFFFVVVFGLKQSVITLTNGWVHKDELIRPGAYLAEGNSCLLRWRCLTLRNIYDGIVTINQQFSKLWYFILPLIV